jgi:hypothetical protein
VDAIRVKMDGAKKDKVLERTQSRDFSSQFALQRGLVALFIVWEHQFPDHKSVAWWLRYGEIFIDTQKCRV